MTELPFTAAENRALPATSLPAFPINMHDVRAKVRAILDNWKSGGLFYEYTDHSFQHVVDMLDMCEWIIPGETQDIMTPADWFMLVVSIYFHDIGLLVTKREFETRASNPDFKSFLVNPVLDADKNREYEARLAQMSRDAADAIRYQDFVRYSHGKRVRAWIDGTHLDDADASQEMRTAIAALLDKLDPALRKDLALLCESHTLSSIDDTNVFKYDRPYGSKAETANLQYVAAILRTVDLLQITHNRAPSILYQLINPSDPTSQVEWKKQNAVKTVRPKPARNRDGAVTNDIPPNTIEVHANFKEPDGFFGLTRYITYAEKELSATYAALEKSKKHRIESYSFNWRFIDGNDIETDGFLQQSFEFELDQHKILDLLTGHTLYNNSTVVLRELTQNALDAVRLQSNIDKTNSEATGHVKIFWKSETRSLIVEDNGTGMSQEIVEKHLLKVGSSRYQDAKFREHHPDFHSISRFGIGVLSAFMVSDDVEITTCSPDDEQARRIALRSVHGKYLIKLLDKSKDRDELPMYPHGTSVKIVLRPTSEIGDILKVARQWLMFPRCRVLVYIDENEPVEVGYDSPEQALRAYIDTSFHKGRFKKEYAVKQYSSGGTTLAFAVAKDELFKDWGLVDIARARAERDDESVVIPVATCVEGVAVQQNTPGFQGISFLAVANSIGRTAPRTNVARSALEDTEEYRDLLAAVYKMYADHVSAEMKRLATDGGYSLSRAVGVGPFISSPLTSPSTPPAKGDLLGEALSCIPFVLLEEAEGRKSVSLDNLSKLPGFHTVVSPLYRSIEYFVREAPADISTQKLLNSLGNLGQAAPGYPVLCNLGAGSFYVDEKIRELFQIDGVTVSAETRSINLHWRRIDTADAIWISMVSVFEMLRQDDPKFANLISEGRDRLRAGRSTGDRIYIPIGDVSLNGFDEEGAFVLGGEKYLLPGTHLATLLAEEFNKIDENRLRRLGSMLLALDVLRAQNWGWEIMNEDLMARAVNALSGVPMAQYIDQQSFLSAIRNTSGKIFDPFAWDKRSGFGLAGVGLDDY